MPGLLDDEVFTIAKAAIVVAMDQVAGILRRTSGQENDGGLVDTWSYTSASAGGIPAMLSSYFGRRAGRDFTTEQRLSNLSYYQITLPAGTDILTTDRVQIPFDPDHPKVGLFQVASVTTAQSYEMERRALAAKLS